MSQKDKVKLGVALVVLVGAGVLIWMNVREPAPAAPKQATNSTANSGGQAQPANGEEPVRNGGRGTVKK